MTVVQYHQDYNAVYLQYHQDYNAVYLQYHQDQNVVHLQYHQDYNAVADHLDFVFTKIFKPSPVLTCGLD